MRQETWNWIVPEGLWEIPKPLLPPSRVRPQGGGTPDTPDETLFAAIIYVLVSGCAWRQLPCSTPPQPPTNATPPTTWPSSASQPPVLLPATAPPHHIGQGHILPSLARCWHPARAIPCDLRTPARAW
ncbi:transposase [Streptomyces chrestomyceticus]|uniref:transposase n=1 Tax=Streptomyces chrestomyceticus TaxID=68185 RepID=UPI002467F993|nr:transposase [Streptomyces chrestomyceticus]